eukprot:17414-Heterococcus_DN1.PRE.2
MNLDEVLHKTMVDVREHELSGMVCNDTNGLCLAAHFPCLLATAQPHPLCLYALVISMTRLTHSGTTGRSEVCWSLPIYH